MLDLPLDEVSRFDSMGSELLVRSGSGSRDRLLETLTGRVCWLVGNQGRCVTYNKHELNILFTHQPIDFPCICV